MTNNDLDTHLIKCIGLLYESRKLRKGDPVPLQYVLEEAIFQKTGVVKDYTDMFQSLLPPRENDNSTSNMYEDKGSNSDNDLELDLLKEDLMCVVCNKMDVGARNRLLECSDCHALYHQECHRPVVTDEDFLDTWTCSNCKSISKKLKISEKDHGSRSLSSKSGSSSHRHGSSSHKSSSDKYKVSKSPSSSSSSSGSSKGVSPNHSSLSSSRLNTDEKKTSKSKSTKGSEKRKHEH
ncbi:integrator complex subunit 12 [Cylas formicarius]|uniref:integrator complex subunit 12 n=1 Tax=Cylas formicarius TaxID=197179 RepID=UPI002958D538|nr:integrator complex subunit 12 [Cylas formicarius]